MRPLPGWIKEPVWLNDENAVVFKRSSGAPEPNGALWCHRDLRTEDKWCIGGFQWSSDVPAYPSTTFWELVARDPLTVRPSLRCLSCGAHGFITDGKWVPV